MTYRWKKKVFGVGGAVGFLLIIHFYWKHQLRTWDSYGEKLNVLVIKKDIPAGIRIRSDDLDVQQIPRIFCDSTVLTAEAGTSVWMSTQPFYTRAPLKKGEHLSTSKIISKEKKLGLAWGLLPDDVAVSVKCSLDEAVAGFIQPGDWVRVFGVLDRPGVVIKEAQVLSVLQEGEGLSSETANKRVFSLDMPLTLTLSIKQELAPLLARAREQGRISLALLPILDNERGQP